MEDTINRLLGILNKYSIKEVNTFYRDKEVELEKASFTKYPDVKWSDNMKKRMIQEAKRKRISTGRRKYIEEQIIELNDYNIKQHTQEAENDVIRMFENLNKTEIPVSDIVLLHIEFSDGQHLAQIQAYGKYKDKWYENELGGFESQFDSAKYWDELVSRKFYSMSEQLEIVEVENEEYPDIYHQIRELRVFNSLRNAFKQPKIIDICRNEMQQGKIEVGIHDDQFYTIYEII